ncbi:TetR/AcrR family transcriptional regulator [Streptomyces sp. NPDC058375]|uniref:TetR/AcrR family transcriptional regulator n=1 Tax=Streptomyces sp. NPDC058375 TaxID=3346467 RepID=UPI003662EECD
MSRSLRADAQANYDRLMEAAARVFAQEGSDTSLKAVAAEAGVGIGTLYRRFPTREDLIEAVYRNETERLCASVPRLLEANEAVAALKAWMESFVDYMLTKQGMADALPSILATREGLRLHSREGLHEAIAALIEAGIAAESLRRDAVADDVLMALGGITLITGHERQRDLASRLITLLLDGLAPDRGASQAKA